VLQRSVLEWLFFCLISTFACRKILPLGLDGLRLLLHVSGW
jgi:hypothetical protein